MFRRNIAIAILILVVVAVFTAAIMIILPHGSKSDSGGNTGNVNSSQPMVKISDIIGEAVYMGSYDADTEIYAEEPFPAKDVLRSALAKSSGIPDSATLMIESHDFDTLSVVFDDGRTMRTLEQPGVGTVMIVASIPKANSDVFYAYNVQINVKESRLPKTTEGPAVSETITTSVQLVSEAPYWNWDDAEETEAVTTKKTWTAPKTTTAAGASPKPSVTAAAVTKKTEAPAVNPVTEAPKPSPSPTVATDPPAPASPSVEPSVNEPAPQPEPEPEPQPEPQPQPEPEPEPEPEPAPQAEAPAQENGEG